MKFAVEVETKSGKRCSFFWGEEDTAASEPWDQDGEGWKGEDEAFEPISLPEDVLRRILINSVTNQGARVVTMTKVED